MPRVLDHPDVWHALSSRLAGKDTKLKRYRRELEANIFATSENPGVESGVTKAFVIRIGGEKKKWAVKFQEVGKGPFDFAVELPKRMTTKW